MAVLFLAARYVAVLDLFPASGPGAVTRMFGMMAMTPMVKMSTFIDYNFGQNKCDATAWLLAQGPVNG
jgi:hypothetical protein